ncbi:hypothetical protein L2E82_24786 [Cichorium intybus]|uniref:Uncharacterized protein n=1 Tax=Cichorium intybus TaxID=13427 RepID=A0ACB9E1F9_CICIN|nr:hypothetical protein L2E82_24786 [Cichorium intybus]
MALNLQKSWLILVMMYLFVNYSTCSNHTLLAKRSNLGGFAPALATWYGDRDGAGSGGACGWANDVKSPPFSAMIAAGNANLFLKGKGCGTCYQVLCTREPYCSKNPITVTITDECPGACNNVPFHFDLSGTAFGAMSSPGQADDLRNLGVVNIQYRRVACNYGSTKIAFKIDPMVNPYWFALAVEFCDGDGGLDGIEVAPNGTQEFRSLENIWGAVWAANVDPSFRGPFSFKLTSRKNEAVVALKAVPYGFEPGQTYYSHINFRI